MAHAAPSGALDRRLSRASPREEAATRRPRPRGCGDVARCRARARWSRSSRRSPTRSGGSFGDWPFGARAWSLSSSTASHGDQTSGRAQSQQLSAVHNRVADLAVTATPVPRQRRSRSTAPGSPTGCPTVDSDAQCRHIHPDLRTSTGRRRFVTPDPKFGERSERDHSTGHELKPVGTSDQRPFTTSTLNCPATLFVIRILVDRGALVLRLFDDLLTAYPCLHPCAGFSCVCLTPSSNEFMPFRTASGISRATD